MKEEKTTHDVIDDKLILHIEINQSVEFPIYRAWMVWDNLISVKLSLLNDGMILKEEVNRFYSSQEIHHKFINWNWFLNQLVPYSPLEFEEAKLSAMKRYPDRIVKYKRIGEDFLTKLLLP